MTIKKITLVYPGIVALGFGSFGKGGMDRNWINLGILYLASYLKKHGYEAEMLDLRALESWDDFRERLARSNADLVGVYVNTPNFNNGIKCCEIAKSMGKPVVVGGPHPSIDPESLLHSGVVDYVVKGEGEVSLLQLVEQLNKGAAPAERIIEGVFVEDLDSLPFPDRSLYDVEKAISPVNNFPFIDNGVGIMCSRGCPFRCSFCQPLARKMFGEKVRFRSPANVVAEVKEVVDKYKVNYMSFEDDTFTARKKWVLEFCELMMKQGIKVQWSAQSRVDTLDEEMVKAMKKAGCVCLYFGFESGSQKILDFLNKGITAEQSLRAAKLCKKHGILILADIMMGIPTETKEDLDKTIALLEQIRPELLSMAYFTPMVGSDLYEYCKKEGLVLMQTYEQYSRNVSDVRKVANMDYDLVNRYRARAEQLTLVWYQSLPFASYAFKRWFFLLKKGYTGEVFRELASFTALPYPFKGLHLKSRIAGALASFSKRKQ